MLTFKNLKSIWKITALVGWLNHFLKPRMLESLAKFSKILAKTKK